MENIDRNTIHTICRNSNWSEVGVENALKENVYNNALQWQKFLKLFFMSLGVCFVTLGVIFFFAFNWADLNKFAKLGLVASLIIATTLFALFSRLNEAIKNIILTGAAVLVGVLFSVFGQIYQTGANAYDFFLGWTVFIVLWVFVANFAPLWLLFLGLLNTTLYFYSQQVAHNWSYNSIIFLLVALNLLFLVAALSISKFNTSLKSPNWFTNIITLACVSLATVGISIGIFDEKHPEFYALLTLTAVFYSIGFLYGLRKKNLFYLSIIPFSLINIACAELIKISSSQSMILLITLFIIISVTLLIKFLLDTQKKWGNG